MDPSYNSFGSFDSGGQPIASGAVMPANDTKKKKRWLIIGVILAVVAVAGVVGFLLMPRKETSKTAEQKLNGYSNLLLYGKSDDGQISLDDRWDSDYFANKIIHADEEFDKEYFDDLEKKYEEFSSLFVTSYKEEGFNSSEEYEFVSNLIKTLKNQLSLSREYAEGISDGNIDETDKSILASKVVSNSKWIYNITSGYGENSEK